MSLPAQISYAAPTDLPQNRVASWRLDRDRAAVLVHDMQKYFVAPYAPDCPALLGAVERTREIVEAARAAGVPVFYTAQVGNQELASRGLQADLWGPGMRAVAEHTDIVPDLAPADGDTVLVKHRYSAFAKSDLADMLTAGGRDQLVITGVYAHIGVMVTAYDAFMREVHPFVVADAVADFGPEQHRRALEQVASSAGVVTTSAHVLSAFGPDSPAVPANGFAVEVAAILSEVLDPEYAASVLAAPEADMFELGLNSLMAFEVLDRLMEVGVDVDFGDFTGTPTLTFLLEQGAHASPAFA